MVFTNNRLASLFIVFAVTICFFANPGLSKFILDEDTDQNITDVSCYKNNGQTPMIGDTPHPYDCNIFVTCIYAASGGVTYIYQNCQTGHDFNRLFYDFRRCMCLERENVQCFNPESEQDENDRFICAQEANPQSNI